MKLLLHVCCAPCAIYPAKEAKTNNINLTGFFYNPNIQPRAEYEKRKQETNNYFKSEKTELIVPEYDSSIFLDTVNIGGNSSKRCKSCWRMRIKRAASFAKENGFDCFTTTLLASPYQDHDLIIDLFIKYSDKNNIDFFYYDFRIGFRKGQDIAKETGLYRQKYCGCLPSIQESSYMRKKAQ